MKSTFETSLIIRASALVVWCIITDTTLWSTWGPSVTCVRTGDRFIQADSKGYIRTVFGLWLPFEITYFENEKHWSWRVGNIAATGHRVANISAGRCRLTFEVPVFAPPYLIVCMIAGLRIRRLAQNNQKH